MRTNPFDALILGLYFAVFSVLSLNVSEAFALQGYRVATAFAIVLWVVFAGAALWLCGRALRAGIRWFDNYIIAYQIKNYPLTQ